MFRDSKSHLWIGSKDGYLREETLRGDLVGYLQSDGTTTKLRKPCGLSCYCMMEGSDGLLWIGTKGDGLVCLTRTGGGYAVRRYTANDGLPDNRVYSLAEDAYHRIWIGTYGGGIGLMARQANGQCAIKRMAKAPKEAKFVHALKVVDGTLVVATTQGLLTSKVNKNADQMTFRQYRRNPFNAASLCNNGVMDVVVSPEVLIFPTLGGGCSVIGRC